MKLIEFSFHVEIRWIYCLKKKVQNHDSQTFHCLMLHEHIAAVDICKRLGLSPFCQKLKKCSQGLVLPFPEKLLTVNGTLGLGVSSCSISMYWTKWRQTHRLMYSELKLLSEHVCSVQHRSSFSQRTLKTNSFGMSMFGGRNQSLVFWNSDEPLINTNTQTLEERLAIFLHHDQHGHQFLQIHMGLEF